MKNPEVCRGCKYRMNKNQMSGCEGACNYSDVNKKSRLVIEMQNGGYRKDSCICKEKGRRPRKEPEKMILTVPKGV